MRTRNPQTKRTATRKRPSGSAKKGSRESAGLSLAQEQAIPLFLEPLTNAERARRLRIGERTLYDWLAKPEFRAALEEQASRHLKALQGAAVTVLSNALRDESGHVRLRAAELILKGTGLLVDKAEMDLGFKRPEEAFAEIHRRATGEADASR